LIGYKKFNRKLIGEILAFCEQVEVLEPDERKARVHEIAKKTAGKYR